MVAVMVLMLSLCAATTRSERSAGIVRVIDEEFPPYPSFDDPPPRRSSRPAVLLAVIATVLAIVGDVLIYEDLAGQAVVTIGLAVLLLAIALTVNRRTANLGTAHRRR